MFNPHILAMFLRATGSLYSPVQSNEQNPKLMATLLITHKLAECNSLVGTNAVCWLIDNALKHDSS